MLGRYILKRLQKGSRSLTAGLDLIVGAIGRVRALRPAIRRVVEGDQAPGRHHAVYVHFDRWGVVHDYVLQAVRDLADNGYVVTFVSNSPTLPDDQIEPLLPMVREVVHRRNAGYDFGAYRDGIARLPPLEDIERLILLNDSVYGPIFPLGETLDAAERAGVDAFGITDSWDVRYHLQSYFLVFFPEALRSRAFRKFWRQLPTVDNKTWLIRNGEVKLSSVLAREKLRLAALCPYWDVSRAILAKLAEVDLSEDSPLMPDERKFLTYVKAHIVAGKPINPTHYYWDALITDWACPFLKRELIQSNPAGVPRPWAWETLLREKTAYDTNLVLRHLKSL